jgi:hypothetical protein
LPADWSSSPAGAGAGRRGPCSFVFAAVLSDVRGLLISRMGLLSFGLLIVDLVPLVDSLEVVVVDVVQELADVGELAGA